MDAEREEVTDLDVPLVEATKRALDGMGIPEPERFTTRDVPGAIRPTGGWVRIVLRALREAGATVTFEPVDVEADAALGAEAVRLIRASRERRRQRLEEAYGEAAQDDAFRDAMEDTARPLDARNAWIRERIASIRQARQFPVHEASLPMVETVLAVADSLEPSLCGSLEDVALLLWNQIQVQQAAVLRAAFDASPDEIGEAAVRQARQSSERPGTEPPEEGP